MLLLNSKSRNLRIVSILSRLQKFQGQIVISEIFQFKDLRETLVDNAASKAYFKVYYYHKSVSTRLLFKIRIELYSLVNSNLKFDFEVKSCEFWLKFTNLNSVFLKYSDFLVDHTILLIVLIMNSSIHYEH
jgi:hypothetical protein